MKVIIQTSKLVKPFYGSTQPPPTDIIPLSVFDKVTWNMHIAVVYAYGPSTPATGAIELGLRKVLAVYREMAGRLSTNDSGEIVILRNDAGVRFIEAFADRNLDETVSFMPSEPAVKSLHPPLDGVKELTQIQITRFNCGSMVLGFTLHHMVADANATSNFLAAWGKACRNIEISPLPFHDRTIFTPRDPPVLEFDHKGVEFMPENMKDIYDFIDDRVEDIRAEKFHFTAEFISKIKSKASSLNPNKNPFSTFESIVAHIWRAVTKARQLDVSETTRVRISVDCRNRIKDPKVPNCYLGNMVLWAIAKAKVDELLYEPLGHAAKLLHDAIIAIDEKYIKSFIDFAHNCAEAEDLIPTIGIEQNRMIFCPDMDAGSWLRLAFNDLDFGCGAPYAFSPCFSPIEGDIVLMPSFVNDGSIDVYVPLFHEHMKVFKNICYSLY